MNEPIRVAIYARVSTGDQHVETQLHDLEKYVALRNDWTLVENYIDEGISGTRESRPELDRLMADARKRCLDLVLVWRFDRFARSTKHLIDALSEFQHLGIDFCSYSENVDTSSPAGKMLFTVIAAIAEFERAIIVERVRAGLRRARAEGKQLGRRPLNVNEDELIRLRRDGLSIRQIAAEMGISKTKVAVMLKQLTPDTEVK